MIQRLQASNIQRVWNSGKSILLLGPRQTGKTTLAEKFEYDLQINFLSTRVRQAYERDPDLLIKEVHALRQTKIPKVLIDEVQKVPEIMDPIQLLIDKKKAQFFITGSSARKLKQQSDINLLPGRVISFRLDGFSSEEFEQKKIEESLYYGSLPGVTLTADSSSKEELLQTYVEVYLEEEIRKEARLKSFLIFIDSCSMQQLKRGMFVPIHRLLRISVYLMSL
jgi:predicted AAA+ superfamily ATPase